MSNKSEKVHIGNLNAALSMLLAMPEFTEPLRRPGSERVQIGPIGATSMSFIEMVCKNGCGAIINADAGRRVIAFKDCLINIGNDRTASVVRDPARSKLRDFMTQSEIAATAMTA